MWPTVWWILTLAHDDATTTPTDCPTPAAPTTPPITPAATTPPITPPPAPPITPPTPSLFTLGATHHVLSRRPPSTPPPPHGTPGHRADVAAATAMLPWAQGLLAVAGTLALALGLLTFRGYWRRRRRRRHCHSQLLLGSGYRHPAAVGGYWWRCLARARHGPPPAPLLVGSWQWLTLPMLQQVVTSDPEPTSSLDAEDLSVPPPIQVCRGTPPPPPIPVCGGTPPPPTIPVCGGTPPPPTIPVCGGTPPPPTLAPSVPTVVDLVVVDSECGATDPDPDPDPDQQLHSTLSRVALSDDDTDPEDDDGFELVS
jgi:hypothetical protein